jgi:zinc protease
VVGWERDLEKTITFDDVEYFKRIFYAPNYCTIVICGDFDSDQAGLWVLEYYGGWRKSLPPTTQVRSERKQTKQYRRDLEWKDSHCQKRILIGYKCPDLNFDTPDLVALKIISHALCSGMGRWFGRIDGVELGIKEIGCDIDGRKDTGLFVIDVMLTADQDFDSVLVAIESELDNIGQEGITDLELIDAIDKAKSDFLFSLGTPSGIGSKIGHYHMVGGDYRMMFIYYDMLGTITSADIKEAAGKYLIPEKSTVVTLSPLVVSNGN